MKIRMALLALGMAACGFAQTLVANIPFSFHVGDQNYAPGRYTLSQNVSSADTAIVWAMHSSELGTHIMFRTSTPLVGSKASAGPRLIFHRYGTTHFLSQVWAGGRQGRQLSPSNAERETARRTLVAEIVTVDLVR